MLMPSAKLDYFVGRPVREVEQNGGWTIRLDGAEISDLDGHNTIPDEGLIGAGLLSVSESAGVFTLKFGWSQAEAPPIIAHEITLDEGTFEIQSDEYSNEPEVEYVLPPEPGHEEALGGSVTSSEGTEGEGQGESG
jgi:hypothetical protein